MLRYASYSALVILLLLLSFPAALLAAGQPSDDIREAMESTVAKVKPALVRIHVVTTDYAEGKEQKSEAYGSGVIISAEGQVITNHHVAGDATQITCDLANNEQLDAELVGTDPLTDISVIKLMPDKPRAFPFASFGDSNALQVGDRIFAMGSPLAFSQSVTMGIISNTQLVLPDMIGNSGFMLDGEDIGSLVRWIAHDAAIYPGNSGGPLVNMQGRIVGINEIALGLSGAIPGNLAKEVAEQIIKSGKVSRSWLGLIVQPMLKGSSDKHGVLVTGALGDSPAMHAGFLPGDVLVKLNGKAVDVHYKEELPPFNYLTTTLPIGKTIEAVVVRKGKEMPLHVVPEPRRAAQPKQREFKEWGMCASDISPSTAKEMKRSSTVGALVTSVRAGGPADAAKPSLNAGDVIMEVAGKPVVNLANLRQVTQSVTEGKTEPVSVMVAFERRTERYLTIAKIGIQERKDPGREISKAWLPVNTQVLTRDLADALGISGRMGVRVTQVYPNTAASKADLKVGDILVKLDGVAIEASEPEDTEVLPAMIRQYKIGNKAVFNVLRAGKEIKVPVELDAAPKLPREMARYQDPYYDFATRDIAFLDRAREKWGEHQVGVIVESVGEGGWAALGRLQAQDLLYALNGEPVTNVESLESIMKRVCALKQKTVLAVVKRGIHNVYLELPACWIVTKQ